MFERHPVAVAGLAVFACVAFPFVYVWLERLT